MRASPRSVLCTLGLALAPLLGGCAGDDPWPVAWVPCGARLECAELVVPLDHAVPDGDKVIVPLVRHPAGNPSARIGSLVVNPGGPGASGVAYVASAWDVMPASIADRFDLVGFDPRGVASSTPAITCGDDLDAFVGLDPSPDDAAERQAMIDETDALVAACEARSGDLLRFVGTDSVARDLDALREALGEDKLTYLGFSYGTFIGATYAEMFPDHVRALVLDGAIDPKLTGDQMIHDQALGFEATLDAFLADCATDAACAFHSAGDPGAAYDALRASIEAAPLAAADGRKLGPGELAYGVSTPLYRRSSWPRLAEALAEAAAGDGTGLLALSDSYVDREGSGQYGDGIGAYYAVTSIDTTFARDTADYDALAAELAASAPRLGASLPYTALPSARWKETPWRTAGPFEAIGAPPVLVVGSTGDPATPYAWAVSLAAQLDSGVLLTRVGEGHTAFLKGNACIDGAIADYLIHLDVPEDGTECP